MVWRRSAHIVSGGRPRGITFLALYYGAAGVGIVAITLVAVYAWGEIPVALEAFQFNPEILVAIALIVGAVLGLTAWGLWNLRAWSRPLAVALSVVGAVFGFFTLPLGLASILLNMVTFWYVTHERVAAVFAPGTRPSG